MEGQLQLKQTLNGLNIFTDIETSFKKLTLTQMDINEMVMDGFEDIPAIRKQDRPNHQFHAFQR